AHMVSDGQYVYVWTSVAPMGFKAKITAGSDASGAASGGQQDFYGQNYDYDCKPWIADESKFLIQSNVTFSENGMAPATGGTSAGIPSGMNCAMCDQSPNAQAKAACRSALSCN